MNQKFLILALVLVLSNCQTPQQIVNVQENLEYQVTMAAGEVRQYIFTLALVPDGKTDFTVYASGDDYRSDMDVYISSKPNFGPKTDLYTTDADTVACNSWGDELCSLDVKAMQVYKQGDSILFDIKCEQICSGTFRVQYAQKMKLVLGDKISYIMKSNKVAVFDFYIPLLANEIEILLSFDLQNYQDLTEGYFITLTDSQNNQVQGETNWNLGKSFVIKKGEMSWCTDCTLTIDLKAPEGSKFKISSVAYENFRQIQIGETVKDAATYSSPTTLVLNYTDALGGSFGGIQQDLIIDVQPFHGQPSIYVNVDKMPLKLSESDMVFDDWEGEELITITPDQYASKSPANKNIYITVGNDATTFSLQTYFTDTQGLWLEDGLKRAGEVEQTEIMEYTYEAWGIKNKSLQFGVSTLTGNPDLFVIRCNSSYSSSCGLTQAQMEAYYSRDGCYLWNNKYWEGSACSTLPSNTDCGCLLCTKCSKDGFNETNANGDVIWWSLNAKDSDIIKMKYDPAECGYDDTSGGGDFMGGWWASCQYKIYVYGQSEETSKYLLQVSNDKTITYLKENEAEKSFIGIEEYQYYQFATVIDSEFGRGSLNSVLFQITLITGDITVYCSRTNLYPDGDDATTYDKVSWYYEPIIFNKDEDPTITLNGSYYLAVYGYDAAYYQIRALVTYLDKDGNIVNTTIRLHEGEPASYMIRTANEIGVFQFNLNLEEEFTGDVYIIINPDKGKYDVRCDTNIDNLWINPKWESYSEQYRIRSTDKNFLKKGIYYCAVQLSEMFSENEFNSTTAYKFDILYTIGARQVRLDINTAQYYEIPVNEYGYFKIDVQYSISNVTIIQENDYQSNYPTLYASWNRSNPYPSSDRYNKKASLQSNTMVIQREEYKDNCYTWDYFDSNPTDGICTIYFTIDNNGAGSMELATGSIQNYEWQAYIKARDGRTNSMIEPTGDSPRYIYYLPWLNGRDIEIIGESDDEIEASISLQLVKGNDPKNWTWPTNTTANYTLTNNFFGEYSYSVSYNDTLKTCKQDDYTLKCALLITLTNINADDSYYLHPLSSIIVTQTEVPLKEGKARTVYMRPNSDKLFIFNVPEGKDDLMIVLNTKDDADVVGLVKIGKGLPTWDDFDFIITPYGEEMQLISFAEFPDKFPSGTIEGQFTILVKSGDEKAQFTLIATCLEKKIFELKSGRPERILVEAGQWVYFLFTPMSNWVWDDATQDYIAQVQDFDFFINEEFGMVNIYVSQFPKTKFFEAFLPDENVNTWSFSMQQFQQRIHINSKDPLVKAESSYIAGVLPLYTSKFNILAKYQWQPVYLRQGQPLTDYLRIEEVGRYYLPLEMKRNTDILISLSYGNVSIFASFMRPKNWDEGQLELNEAFFPYQKNVQTKAQIKEIKIKEDQFPDTFSEDDYGYSTQLYIAVQAHKDSEYQLFIEKPQEDYNILQSQNPAILKLDPHQTARYLIYQKEEADNLVLTLEMNENLEAFNDLNNMDSRLLFADQVSQSNLTDDAFSYYGDFKRYDERNLRFYELKPKIGVYLIIITNKDKTRTMEFSLGRSTNYLKEITMGQQVNGRVFDNDYRFYRINVLSAGALDVQLTSCLGEIMLYSTTDKQNIIDKNFKDADSAQPFSKQQLHKKIIIPVAGTYYLAIYGIKGFQNQQVDKQGFYQMQVNYFTNEQIAISNILVPGNDGNIEWKYDSQNQLYLNWQTTSSAENGGVYDWLKTEIVCSDVKELTQMQCKCQYTSQVFGPQRTYGLYNSILQNHVVDYQGKVLKGRPMSYQVDDNDMINTTFYCMIMEVYNETQEIIKKKVFYNLVQVQKPEKLIQQDNGGFMDNANIYFWFGVVLVVLILCCLVVLYQRRKIKDTVEQLDVEMSDVRNIAHVEFKEEDIEDEKIEKVDQ